jgi:hypothetical protein
MCWAMVILLLWARTCHSCVSSLECSVQCLCTRPVSICCMTKKNVENLNGGGRCILTSVLQFGIHVAALYRFVFQSLTEHFRYHKFIAASVSFHGNFEKCCCVLPILWASKVGSGYCFLCSPLHGTNWRHECGRSWWRSTLVLTLAGRRISQQWKGWEVICSEI